MGGLSEKANIFRKIKKNTGGRVISVDAGNALFRNKAHYPPGTAQFINASAVAEIYTMLGLDAVAVGLSDLSGGLDLLRETGKKGLPWISANLYEHDGTPVFPPFISKAIDNISVAVVGVTAHSDADSADFVIKDGAEALAGLVPMLDEEFDLIILLAAMSLAETSALVEFYPQIDIAVAADAAKDNIAPFQHGTALLMQTGSRGQYQGVLSVDWQGGPRKNNSTFEYRFLPLADTGRDDPQIEYIIREAQKRISTQSSQ